MPESSIPVPVSLRVRARLERAGRSFNANDNIAAFLEPGDIEAIEQEVRDHVTGLLAALVIDTANDHNTQDTAARVAKMFCREVFAGRYEAMPCVTTFPNVKHVDECYAVGPISVRSSCSHHMVPIMGQAWIGIVPAERLIGLSKFNRLTEWIMARPQIQEEAAEQLADAIEAQVTPRGLGVIIRAKHFCCAWRGVRDASEMTTSVLRGVFKTDHSARAELLSLIAGMGY